MPKDKRTYITLAVDMPDHPKLAALTKGQRWLVVEALMYCRKYKTDGVIDATVWRRMDTKRNREAVERSGMCIDLATESQQNRDRIADEFRQKTGDVLPNSGVFFSDYAEHQQTRREIEAATAAKKAAGSKGGKARAANAEQAKSAEEDASATQAAASDVLKQTLKQNQAEEEEEEEKELLTYVSSSSHLSNAGEIDNALPAGPAVPPDAWRLVRDTPGIGPMPHATKCALALAASQLLHAGTSDRHIAAALALWMTKPSAGPGLLPHLVADAIKAEASPRSPHNGSAHDSKVMGYLEAGKRLTGQAGRQSDALGFNQRKELA